MKIFTKLWYGLSGCYRQQMHGYWIMSSLIVFQFNKGYIDFKRIFIIYTGLFRIKDFMIISKHSSNKQALYIILYVNIVDNKVEKLRKWNNIQKIWSLTDWHTNFTSYTFQDEINFYEISGTTLHEKL